MNASGPVGVGAEAGATLLSLTSVAGGVYRPKTTSGSKRHKEGTVAKNMLMRCAEDAA